MKRIKRTLIDFPSTYFTIFYAIFVELIKMVIQPVLIFVCIKNRRLSELIERVFIDQDRRRLLRAKKLNSNKNTRIGPVGAPQDPPRMGLEKAEKEGKSE